MLPVFYTTSLYEALSAVEYSSKGVKQRLAPCSDLIRFLAPSPFSVEADFKYVCLDFLERKPQVFVEPVVCAQHFSATVPGGPFGALLSACDPSTGKDRSNFPAAVPIAGYRSFPDRSRATP